MPTVSDDIRVQPSSRSLGIAALFGRYRRTLGVYAASRLCVFVAAQAVGWLQPSWSVARVLNFWDGGWYISIAEHGYPDTLDIQPGSNANHWAFHPFVPLTIRAVSTVTGLSSSTSAVLGSTVLGAIAFCLVRDLLGTVLADQDADFGVDLLAFFPAAYVFSMGYTEPAFMLFAAASLLAVRREQWVLAGLMASGATLVRVPGLGVVAAVGVAAILAMRGGMGRRPLWALALAPIGYLSWLAYQWKEIGTPRASLIAQEYWQGDFEFLTQPFRSAWRVLTYRDRWADGGDFGATIAVLIVAASIVVVLRRWRAGQSVPVDWMVYSATAVVFAFTPSLPFSVLRYSMAAFPLWAVGASVIPSRARAIVLAASAGLMCVFAMAIMLSPASPGLMYP